MTRRLEVVWPDPALFRARSGRPIRILAVSDIFDPALAEERNRCELGPIDLILGCGDLDCDDLAFVTDGFAAPLLHVLGNHDSAERWAVSTVCPSPMLGTSVKRAVGVAVAGLSWPGRPGRRAVRSDFGSWQQVLSLALRRLRSSGPLIIISHVPPLGLGDEPNGTYHRGFRAYLWLLERLRPCLWLHGHTPLASARDWRTTSGDTVLANVAGAVLIELVPPEGPATAVDGGESQAPTETPGPLIGE